MTGRKAYTNAPHASAFDCTSLRCSQSISACITSLNERYTFSSKVLETSFLCISRNLQSAQQIPNVGELRKSDLRVSGIEGGGTNALVVYKFSPPYLFSA